jgi:adenylate kinase
MRTEERLNRLNDFASGTVSGRNIIILLGAPGAGKGTQAERIANWLSIPHISTGQLLRSEIAAETPLGLHARATIETGALVNDGVVHELVVERISRKDCARGFVLDGYPRNVIQAVMLERHIYISDRQVVIDLFLEFERILARLTGRLTCTSCGAIYHKSTSPSRRAGVCNDCENPLVQRPDDREEVIRERFKLYHDVTSPLVNFYRQLGIYHRVNGMHLRDDLSRFVARGVSLVLKTAHEVRFSFRSPPGH